MIPVQIYRSKLDDLQSVLNRMGKDPSRVSEWFLQSMAKGQVNMDSIRQKGMHSIALVESMPKTSERSILGMKLTEPTRRAQVQQVLESNEVTVRSEIRDIAEIINVLHHLVHSTTIRIGAVQKYIYRLGESSSGTSEQALQNAETARQLSELVMPTLVNLRNELTQGIEFCYRERHMRVIQLNKLTWKRNWQSRYNRGVRKKRLARWKAKQEQEAKEQEAKE